MFKELLYILTLLVTRICGFWDNFELYRANHTFRIESYEHLNSEVLNRARYMLESSGVVFLELGYEDTEGKSLEKTVFELGVPHEHNAKENSYMWDVKPIGGIARSHTLNEFNLHTDCSFEEPPPRYFGLYVIHEDKLGGGDSMLLHVDTVLSRLSVRSKDILKNTSFKMKVPIEFRKNNEFFSGPIIFPSPLDQTDIVRYRDEVIVKEDLTALQLEALKEFETVLRDPSIVQKFFLKTGSLILVDNGKYFHGRDEIKDPKRHLKRIRFQPKNKL
jgi:hypothetical protein